MKFPLNLQAKIDKRLKDGSYRTMIDLDHLIDFYSNDYFGAAKVKYHSDLAHGSTGSRLISGNSNYVEDLEKDLAAFFNYESGLLFNSGLDANYGIFSSILERGDTVIFDSLIHASIRDGVRMSFAKSYNFKHNDLQSLASKLKLAKGNIYVVVESIYSMDGDISPLAEIVKLAKEYGAYIIVDEAHSGGVIGNEGRGLSHEFDLDEDIFIKLITFSKAYGAFGAVVLCSHQMREYLINFSKPFIYTTAISDFTAGRIRQVFELVKGMNKERKTLRENINYFRSLAQGKSLQITNSSTSIQAIIIPDIKLLVDKINELIEAGFAVRGIAPPTVPIGQERIRICIHAHNTKAEIKSLLDHF
ncbi:8-amino-7-oxononanoate synthase [Putridiphycobacter roseus]|uniref:8-amino-7-oxononanoate synthase n=1 Tax=Putridiphycobacter roseus TaxID=2219161 RepID=A0A2W1N3K2_9FLAO|nr:8-amino-7-oxononanoate synthase [Putridiphycobacter roseus]PZE18434.1 8-amino-7-oxononanoate synthase [Putridiphycobacter roseus]